MSWCVSCAGFDTGRVRFVEDDRGTLYGKACENKKICIHVFPVVIWVMDERFEVL